MIGKVFADWWNSMADFYLVVRQTEKTVWLQELSWSTCTPPEGEEVDPTWRYAKIDCDENGNPLPEKDQFTGKPAKLIKKRLRNGRLTSRWQGCNHPMCLVENPSKDVFHFYWG